MEMARFLIGKVLVRDLPEGRTAGRIVETEAYPPGDASSHAFRGETAARRSMFLTPGHGYVYLAYGSCFCFNISSEPAGIGGGILIRALEPLEGIALMRQRRGTDELRDLARGPGRLALAIDRSLDVAGELCIAGAPHRKERAHRHQPGSPSPAPLLRTGEPLCQRHQAAQLILTLVRCDHRDSLRA
jgi:DNA-3-methyladenine glycosylase